MKFIEPAGITRIPAAEAAQHNTSVMWPIGWLYHVDGTDVYFRFLRMGGRWDPHFGISTNKGIFTGKGFLFPAGKAPTVTHDDRVKLVQRLMKYIGTGEI